MREMDYAVVVPRDLNDFKPCARQSLPAQGGIRAVKNAPFSGPAGVIRPVQGRGR